MAENFKESTVKIPKPVKDEDGELVWFPIVRASKHIPFGYVVSEDDPDLLVPVKEELILLEKAKVYLKRYSYRNVAAWLSAESGREISHVGLYKRVHIEARRRHEAGQAAALAKRYKKAKDKAEKLDKKRIGGVGTRSFPDDHFFTRQYFRNEPYKEDE